MFIAHWEFDVMISSYWFLYTFGTLTCWWYWLILFIILAYWFCFCYDYPAHFDMYVHIVVYLVVLVIDSFACILSWSSLSMLSLLHSSWLSCSSLAYVWTWMIYLRFAWLFVACLLFSCVFTCCLSVWVTHLSPYLQPSSFGHFLHSGSHFSKCETLCVIVL